MASFVLASIALTTVAALRSTWSPCGLSMLSSMTPLTERARGNRFWVTATLYLIGSIAGGLTVGAALAVLAAAVGALDLSATTAAATVAIAALVTGAADLRIGPDVPRHRRQVNEDWFSGYRRWVYATGFGWQIGNGVATYTTTAALYSVAVAAVAGGDPVFALVIGAAFGTIRGLAIGLAVPLTSLDAVRGIHARLDRWAEPSRVVTGVVQVAVAVALAVVVHPALAVGFAAVVAVVTVVRMRSVDGVRTTSAEAAA